MRESGRTADSAAAGDFPQTFGPRGGVAGFARPGVSAVFRADCALLLGLQPAGDLDARPHGFDEVGRSCGLRAVHPAVDGHRGVRLLDGGRGRRENQAALVSQVVGSVGRMKTIVRYEDDFVPTV